MNKNLVPEYLAAYRHFNFIIILFFIVICFIITGVKALFYTSDFLKKVRMDKVSIKTDLDKLQLNYTRQLKFVKDYVEKNGANLQKLQEFFHSPQTLILDRSNIGTIIIANSHYDIIFAEGFSNKSTPSEFKKRKYLNKIKESPDSIVLGETVEGVLTHKLSLPLGTGFRNKNGIFAGVIVFSITLENLNQNLVKNNLFKVSILETTTSSIHEFNPKPTPTLAGFFFSNILLQNYHDSYITDAYFDNKIICLRYDTSKIKMAFLKDTAVYILCLLLFCILIILLFWKHIVRPIQPTLSTLNDLLIENDQNYNTPDNDFLKKVVYFIQLQSMKLHEQKTLYKAHEELLNKTLDISENLTTTFSSRAERLEEGIEDTLLLHNKYLTASKSLLNDLKNVIVSNKRNTDLIVSANLQVLNLLKNQIKQPVNLFEALVESGVAKFLIEFNIPNVQNDTDLQKYELSTNKFLYKDLFIMLVREILSYQESTIKLTKVMIKNNNSLHFVFTVTEDILTYDNPTFTRCKIWGIVNNIQIKMLIDKNAMIITCLMETAP